MSEVSEVDEKVEKRALPRAALFVINAVALRSGFSRGDRKLFRRMLLENPLVNGVSFHEALEEQICVVIGREPEDIDPREWGDGTILKLILEYLPEIIQAFATIFQMFLLV